jgi:tRNA G18 (ribose-2'-O)-methylase SpoU
MRKLSYDEITSRQQIKKQAPRLPFVVVLNNIRSLYNVGSIFRSADGAGVANIYLCGITGYPPDKQISKTALGAQEYVAWEYREDVCSVIRSLKKEGYSIVLLEQTAESVPYPGLKVDEKVCLVLGNEIEGVSGSILGLCDRAIEIGMEGVKNSLNVSVAFGIVAFHIKEQLKQRRLTMAASAFGNE